MLPSPTGGQASAGLRASFYKRSRPECTLCPAGDLWSTCYVRALGKFICVWPGSSLHQSLRNYSGGFPPCEPCGHTVLYSVIAPLTTTRASSGEQNRFRFRQVIRKMLLKFSMYGFCHISLWRDLWLPGTAPTEHVSNIIEAGRTCSNHPLTDFDINRAAPANIAPPR